MADAHDSLLYSRVETVLASEIADGALKAGDQLPTEDDLIRRFEVSRITVRRAIQNLVGRGIATELVPGMALPRNRGDAGCAAALPATNVDPSNKAANVPIFMTAFLLDSRLLAWIRRRGANRAPHNARIADWSS